MRVIEAAKVAVLNLGYAGEKERTEVHFSFADLAQEFPGGTLLLQVSRPGESTKHDVQLTTDGTTAIWLVGEYDLAIKGEGECQLVYSKGTAIAKKKVWKTYVDRSMEGSNASIPPTWQNIENDLLAAATAVQEAVEGYDAMTAEAHEASKPTAEIDRTGDHPVLKLGLVKGEIGDDGYSPTVSVTNITGGHRVTITDKTGTQTVDVMDGDKGDPGATGAGIANIQKTATSGLTDTYTITFTDNRTPITYTVVNGQDGDAVVDDTAGTGDVTKVWSADKLTSEFATQDEEIENLQNNIIGIGTRTKQVFSSSENNIDNVWEYDSSVFSNVVKFTADGGTYTANSTAIALQYDSGSSWVDIYRGRTNSSGNFSAIDHYYIIPDSATKLRMVYHNNSQGTLTFTTYYKQAINQPGNYIYCKSTYTDQGSNADEKQTENIRINLKKGNTYRIGVYYDCKAYQKTTTTTEAIKFHATYGGNLYDSLGRNRLVDNELSFIPYQWTYFDYTPTMDISVCEIYINALKNTGRTVTLYIAFDKTMDLPIGYKSSIATMNGHMLHETNAKAESIVAGGGNGLQALNRLPNGDFISFRSAYPGQSGSTGRAVITKDKPKLEDVTGYSAYTVYSHEEFYHPINSAWLANGNILVSSKLENEERNAYEYDPLTDTIVNSFELPATDPNDQTHASQFILPVNGGTEKFIIGYSANTDMAEALMTVYEYDDGTMTQIGSFNYLPKYTQDSCEYAGHLYIIGNAGSGSVNSYITIVRMADWVVVGMITVDNAGEMEGADIQNNGDNVVLFTAVNNNSDIPFVRTFAIS